MENFLLFTRLLNLMLMQMKMIKILTVAGMKNAGMIQIWRMPVIHDMLETAMYAKELDSQRRQLMRRVDEIDQRFCKLQNGDLTEERCRKDADKLFTKSQNPQEWDLAKAFLCDKYGKEIADFVIKEMD